MGDEPGEEGGILEAERVGRVEDAVRFVVDLATGAEEVEGEMHAFWWTGSIAAGSAIAKPS